MIDSYRVSMMPVRIAENEATAFFGEAPDLEGSAGAPGNPFSGTTPHSAKRPADLGVCASCRSQLRQELAAYRNHDREKAEYTRMLVHELRAPVTASRSLAAALRHVHPKGTQVNDVMARIEKRMDPLLDLVEDILYLNRIKAGQPLGETIDCDLVAETRNICKPYLEEATAKGLTMQIDLPTSPLTVRLATQDYQLMLSNLVSNAIKYTHTGRVEISLRQESVWAVLEILDTGIGIPAGESSLVFTEFFRASNARRSQVPGTGLGLAGVKALVERCRGELALQSRENEGSKFTVRLPRQRQKPALCLMSAETEVCAHAQTAASVPTVGTRAA